MKYISPLFFCLLILFIAQSCSEFCEGECLEESYLPLRILDSADSTDLIFGTNKVYDFEKIKFYNISGTDSIFFQAEKRQYSNSELEGVLNIDHEKFTASQILIDFGNSDIDTLELNFGSFDCCHAEIRFLNMVSHNGITVYQNSASDIVANIYK